MEEITQSDLQGRSETGSKGETERWASIISGSAMVLMGLQQRSLRGALMAIAGGGLAYHGAKSEKSLPEAIADATGLNKAIRVEKTVTINRSASDLYNFWHDFENLPTFMKHLKHVKVYDDKRSHWIASAPLGASVEWDAEVVNDQPDRLIAWASVEGADVDNSGFVRFQPGERGTEVKVVLEYNPPGGALTGALAKLFGEEPEQQVGSELSRFKQLMESGEIATTEGQSSARS